MPGLIGIVNEPDVAAAQVQLNKMVAAMQIEDRYHVDTFIDDGVSLGRLSLGITNSESQPIWNEDKSICIFMEGELFSYQDLKQGLLEAGHIFQFENNDAEFALHLYEELGEQFVNKLNGAFILALWDYRKKRLTIVNDRLGLYPLYYSIQKGRLTFASGVRALLAEPSLRRQVDLTGMSQMLSFEYPLDGRTLLEDVNLLDPATLLIFQKNHLDQRIYWNLEFHDNLRYQSEDEYVEGFLHFMQQAVARQAPHEHPAGALLSGGLDSRMILAFLGREPSGTTLKAFTFGIPGCDDARLAKEVAEKAGFQHIFYELKPDYLAEVAEKGISLTDGQMSCVHMHALANLDAQANDVEIIYKGFLGDALMGGHLNRQLWADYDLETSSRLIFEKETGGFTPDEQEKLFTQDTKNQIKTSAFESFKSILAQSNSTLLATRHSYFDYRQRQRRFTLNGVELVRSRAIVRTPFCDNDLVDFMLGVPPGLRLDRLIMFRALSEAFPNLAKIPYEGTGLPLIPCARDLRIRFERQLRWQLRSFGLRWISPPNKRPYADYAGWLRTDLQTWMENILLNQDTLDRGYFQRAYVHSLVKEHTTGEADHSRKLGILISLELWHRQYID